MTALLQRKKQAGKDEIGVAIVAWETILQLTGWLDLSGGDSKYTYNTKIQESTHVFVADYQPQCASVSAESARLLIDGRRYDIMLIDDPMGMHRQLEIYLKYTGGQEDGCRIL